MLLAALAALCCGPQEPGPVSPGRARMSEAEDGGHARKLYSVFVKQRGSYAYQAGMKGQRQPIGQTVVKEAYHPELVEKAGPDVPSQDAPLGVEMDHFDRYARDGERLYRASVLAGIY